MGFVFRRGVRIVGFLKRKWVGIGTSQPSTPALRRNQAERKSTKVRTFAGR